MGTVPRRAIQSITRTYSAKPPPEGSKPGGAAHFLVGLALGKCLVPAVVAIAARDVMKHDHPVAGLESHAHPRPRRQPRPLSRDQKCGARNASRWQFFSDQCRRFRRCGPGGAIRRGRSPAPGRSPGERRSRRDTRRPAWWQEWPAVFSSIATCPAMAMSNLERAASNLISPAPALGWKPGSGSARFFWAPDCTVPAIHKERPLPCRCSVRAETP